MLNVERVFCKTLSLLSSYRCCLVVKVVVGLLSVLAFRFFYFDIQYSLIDILKSFSINTIVELKNVERFFCQVIKVVCYSCF